MVALISFEHSVNRDFLFCRRKMEVVTHEALANIPSKYVKHFHLLLGLVFADYVHQ